MAGGKEDVRTAFLILARLALIGLEQPIDLIFVQSSSVAQRRMLSLCREQVGQQVLLCRPDSSHSPQQSSPMVPFLRRAARRQTTAAPCTSLRFS